MTTMTVGEAGAVTSLYPRLFAAEPERPFLTVDDVAHSYGDIDSHARRIAAVLGDRGLVAGDRLIARTTKSLDGYSLWLGCLAAGVVYVPANTAYTADELAYFRADADASLLVVDDPAALAAAGTDLGCPVVALAELVHAAVGASAIDVVEVAGADPAALVYTSGTTGRPKGATITHASLVDNARALAEVWQIQPTDVLVHALPVFHIHGLFIALHPLMLQGAQVRFLPRFDVDSVLSSLPGASVFMGVPTHYRRLLDDQRFGPDACASMRLFTSGSAPMTEATHQEFTDRTGHQIVERYGMSEAGIITSNRIGDVVPGSVGRALPSYEIRVVDEAGGPVEGGTTGVVEIRGPSLCAGYWGRPDADAESRTDDGWFRTGDIGRLDDGRLTLEGRSSDMIISGGLNVYPKEVETALDAVDGVVESAVVGVAHSDFGEAVTAFLVTEAGVDLDALPLAEALEPLARFKHPKQIHVVDALPRNAMGKVQKSLLRAGSVSPP